MSSGPSSQLRLGSSGPFSALSHTPSATSMKSAPTVCRGWPTSPNGLPQPSRRMTPQAGLSARTPTTGPRDTSWRLTPRSLEDHSSRSPATGLRARPANSWSFWRRRQTSSPRGSESGRRPGARCRQRSGSFLRTFVHSENLSGRVRPGIDARAPSHRPTWPSLRPNRPHRPTPRSPTGWSGRSWTQVAACGHERTPTIARGKRRSADVSDDLDANLNVMLRAASERASHLGYPELEISPEERIPWDPAR